VTLPSPALLHPAGLAFDILAEAYDQIFTNSLIGRAQRDAVWSTATRIFKRGDRILELNCGTGEDAVFFTQQGITVFACDASEKMIAVANRRRSLDTPSSAVRFVVLPTEEIAVARLFGPFDGVFSNFSGLNCVADIADVAQHLAALVHPGGSALLCLSSRLCLWESCWFLIRGEAGRAVRRWNGHTTATVGGASVKVHYHTVKHLRKVFSPYFHLRSWTGIGVTVPPSYLESLALRHPAFLSKLRSVDRLISGWPVFRSIGDHVLLSFERTSS
jgi:ubiquinone/menaquinone biosynthesis C-methylase UbiE